MSRIAKLMARMEREAIMNTLEKARKHPGSFAADDLERLHEALQDPGIADHLGEGDELAINNYGALCISSKSVPFLDIDTQERSPLRLLQTDLGNAGLGGRLYRTRKGYRIALQQQLSAEELFSRYLPESRLDAYGIDRSYALFCQELGNYRARCSAKPWRIVRRGYERLSQYERWGKYPVVAYVESFGTLGDVTPHWERVMECHDAIGRCTTSQITLY
ncbi:MAG: hypothetical protein VKK04_25665 [Synechococcales bacterium]|nr:hypothetical protein [Synechococcales bacterium]